MTRKYLNNHQELEYYRSRPYPMSISRTTRESTRAYPITHRNNHMSPTQDSDDKTSARRRISVACTRCRKRKIKCSGDPGTGQGCDNCKGVGIDPAACQFNRVNSTAFDMHGPVDWPYLINGLTSAPTYIQPSGSSLSLYGPGSVMPAPSFNHTPHLGTMRAPKYQLGNPYSLNAPLTIMTGHDHYNHYPQETLLDSFSHATAVGSGYLPAFETQYSGPAYGSLPNFRQWASSNHPSRHGHDMLDHDNGTRYSQPIGHFVGPLASPSSHIMEGTSGFPTMGSLIHSLPTPALGDRLLPSPRVGAPADPLSSHAPPVFTDHTVSSQPVAVRTQVPWGPERVATGFTQPPTLPSSSAPGDSSDVSSQRTPSSHEERRVSEFGYTFPPSTGENSPPKGTPAATKTEFTEVPSLNVAVSSTEEPMPNPAASNNAPNDSRDSLRNQFSLNMQNGSKRGSQSSYSSTRLESVTDNGSHGGGCGSVAGGGISTRL